MTVPVASPSFTRQREQGFLRRGFKAKNMNAVVTFYAFKNDFSRDQEKESRCAFPHHAVSCCEPSAHHHTPAVFPRWCLTVGEKQWKGMAEGRPGARDEANKVDPSFTQRISSVCRYFFYLSQRAFSSHLGHRSPITPPPPPSPCPTPIPLPPAKRRNPWPWLLPPPSSLPPRPLTLRAVSLPQLQKITPGLISSPAWAPRGQVWN